MVVDLMRIGDGRVRCCVCFEAKTLEELADVKDEPGMKWDVCAGKCAEQAGLE